MKHNIIYIAGVTKIVKRHRQTIWRWVKHDEFPKPFKIGNRNVWYENSIYEWIESKHIESLHSEEVFLN